MVNWRQLMSSFCGCCPTSWPAGRRTPNKGRESNLVRPIKYGCSLSRLSAARIFLAETVSTPLHPRLSLAGAASRPWRQRVSTQLGKVTPSFPVANAGKHGVPGGCGLVALGKIVVAFGGGVAAMAEQRGGEPDLCRLLASDGGGGSVAEQMRVDRLAEGSPGMGYDLAVGLLLAEPPAPVAEPTRPRSRCCALSGRAAAARWRGRSPTPAPAPPAMGTRSDARSRRRTLESRFHHPSPRRTSSRPSASWTRLARRSGRAASRAIINPSRRTAGRAGAGTGRWHSRRCRRAAARGPAAHARSAAGRACGPGVPCRPGRRSRAWIARSQLQSGSGANQRSTVARSAMRPSTVSGALTRCRSAT